MFLNIITPCSRPENLREIEKSINIPKENYRWIIVFDNEFIPKNIYIPEYCETYAVKDAGSISGNSQRNYALSLVDKGHIYFNDDDTILHRELWDIIKYHSNVDFISFDQKFKNGKDRLHGGKIAVGHIDSHNFVVSSSVCKGIIFPINIYEADGIFAVNAAKNSQTILVIKKTLSIYNYLSLTQ